MSATFCSFCHGQFCENFLELKSPFFTHSALVHLSQHTSSFNNVSSTQFFQKILLSYSHLSLFNSSLFVSKTLPPLTTLSLSLSLSLSHFEIFRSHFVRKFELSFHMLWFYELTVFLFIETLHTHLQNFWSRMKELHILEIKWNQITSRIKNWAGKSLLKAMKEKGFLNTREKESIHFFLNCYAISFTVHSIHISTYIYIHMDTCMCVLIKELCITYMLQWLRFK